MEDGDGYRIKCLNVDLLVLVQVYTCLILMKEKNTPWKKGILLIVFSSLPVSTKN